MEYRAKANENLAVIVEILNEKQIKVSDLNQRNIKRFWDYIEHEKSEKDRIKQLFELVKAGKISEREYLTALHKLIEA